MAATKTSVSKASGKAAAKKRKAKGSSKKTAPKKAAVKKTGVKKSPVKKAPVKKAIAKKTVLKKAPVKKTVTKKISAKKSVKKPVVKKAALKKPVAKAAVRKAVKKTASRKPAAAKAIATKIASKKAVVSKASVRTPKIKKITIPAPVSKVVTAARLSPRSARKSAPLKSTLAKSANGNGQAPTRQKTLNVGPLPVSPLKAPVRRPVSIIPRVKAALPVPIAARIPVRAAIAPRRPARSAARGMAPLPSVALDSLASDKTRVSIDEPLSELKLREHIRIGVLYLEAWLRKSGAEITPVVAELEAPAEAARAQIWRWLDRDAEFDDGRHMTPALLDEVLMLELQLLRKDMEPEVYDAGLFVTSAQLFLDSVLAPDFEDFPGSASKVLK